MHTRRGFMRPLFLIASSPGARVLQPAPVRFMSGNIVSLPLLLGCAFASVACVTASGWYRSSWSGSVALGASALLLGIFAVAADVGPAPLNLTWIPQWRVNVSLRLDGLAIAYGGLTLWTAVIVLAYAPAYMRHHIGEAGRSPSALVPFFTLFMLFVAAMLGMVLSRDLLLFFLFWDLTAICSYLLIAFDRQEAHAREAALTALLVTGISSILLLAAAVLLIRAYGTADLAELLAVARPDALTTAALALLIVAALGKSAQWPLHFWLPRAMAAPTPVSAYLHAAAMVAAGVFLLQRLQPLIEAVPRAGSALAALGWTSMAGAGLLALRADELKRILAYSTIAQYGHVVFLIGLGGAHGAAAAAFFVLAHGVCKSALFLAAGAVTVATGKHALSEVGGLFRQLPVLASATAIAAAGLAGVPLTVGFFKDEALFATAFEHGPVTLALATTGPALTLAYIWRFWRGIFTGAVDTPCRPLPRTLVAPIAASAAVILLFGAFPELPGGLAENAAAAVAGHATLSLAYHFDARATNAAAIAAFVAAALITILLRRGGRAALDASLERPGPARAYDAALGLLDAAGRLLRRHAPRALRTRAAFVLLPALALALVAQIHAGAALPEAHWRARDLPTACALGVTAAAAVVTARQRPHLAAILSLSITTLGLSGVFALMGAPDVALVLVIINVLTTVLLVALLERLPTRILQAQPAVRLRRARRVSNTVLATASAGLAFFVATGTLAAPDPQRFIGQALVDAAPAAHAGNVVTAVLADFRGLDTLGEITVIVISVLAVSTFMRRTRGQE